jgi:hypothetical protein
LYSKAALGEGLAEVSEGTGAKGEQRKEISRGRSMPPGIEKVLLALAFVGFPLFNQPITRPHFPSRSIESLQQNNIILHFPKSVQLCIIFNKIKDHRRGDSIASSGKHTILGCFLMPSHIQKLPNLKRSYTYHNELILN